MSFFCGRLVELFVVVVFVINNFDADANKKGNKLEG